MDDFRIISSKLFTSLINLETVRTAAKLAVYEATVMKAKTHQVAAISLPDLALGTSPPPCGVRVVRQNQKLSFRLKYRVSSSFAISSWLFWKLHGENLSTTQNRKELTK